MKEVTILYFAQLREQSGVGEEIRETEATTLRELYEELAAVYGFTMKLNHMQVASNEVFCGRDAPVENGATIAFMPPMAGG